MPWSTPLSLFVGFPARSVSESAHVVLVRDRTVLRQSQKLEIDAVTKLRHGQRLSGSRTPFDKTQDDLRSPASADKAQGSDRRDDPIARIGSFFQRERLEDNGIKVQIGSLTESLILNRVLDLASHNPLVAGSSPARPTSEVYDLG
jgi:hypothetical protein